MRMKARGAHLHWEGIKILNIRIIYRTCRRTRCIRELIRDTISRIVAIIVSQPFEVVSLRMMAQFVGGETKYRYVIDIYVLYVRIWISYYKIYILWFYFSGLFGSFVEIYRENGILGYYSGLIPRIIANVAVVVLVNASTYAINNYVINEPTIKPYTASTMKVSWLNIYFDETCRYIVLSMS